MSPAPVRMPLKPVSTNWAASPEVMPSVWPCRKIYMTVMRVRTEDGSEHTGVFLPYQVAEDVLEALREAEPELAEVRVAGGEPHIAANVPFSWGQLSTRPPAAQQR